MKQIILGSEMMKRDIIIAITIIFKIVCISLIELVSMPEIMLRRSFGA